MATSVVTLPKNEYCWPRFFRSKETGAVALIVCKFGDNTYSGAVVNSGTSAVRLGDPVDHMSMPENEWEKLPLGTTVAITI